MSDIFNAGDLIGKTLFAKVRVALYPTPTDGSKAFAFVEPGQSIGVVYSYLEPSVAKNRSRMYWMFNDGTLYYYVPHRPGFFDVTSIKQQGVYTAAEKKEMEKAKDATIIDRLESNIKKSFPYILAAVVAIPLLQEVIRKKL
jgi:hypothetical protein